MLAPKTGQAWVAAGGCRAACLLMVGPGLCCTRRLGRDGCRPASAPPLAHPPARQTPGQGDNNWGDDRSLYPKGQLWLNPGHIMGKVVG